MNINLAAIPFFMKKYDSQYYLIEKKDGEHFPSLVADENTEDRTYSYERQLVGTPPLVFFNGWKEENLARRTKATVPDILFNGSNPVVRSDIREKLLNYDIPNFHMHPTVYIHDDGKPVLAMAEGVVINVYDFCGGPLGKSGHLVGIKVPSDMLHLELYGTTESPRKTALSPNGTPPYQRRKVLFDPTPSIDIAEMK